MEDRERHLKLQIIRDGIESDYLKVLKEVVVQWIDEEGRVLDSFKRTGIKEGKAETFNRSVDRLELLNKFLTINEVVVKYNETILERSKEVVSEAWRKVNTFVSK